MTDPYRTPSPPETSEQEFARLSAELQVLQMLNAIGVPAEESARRQRWWQVVSARISTIRAAWDREAWWRAMTDQQRQELIELGCPWCGSLDPRCYCRRDD